MSTTSPPQLTEQLVIRFTPEDRARIEQAARREHRRAAEWIRVQALVALKAKEDRAA